MHLYSWNVNGFRAIVKKGFFDYLKSCNPDIICLQEVKLNDNQIESKIKWDLFVKENYYTYWHNGTMVGYSGVAIFSKIKAKKISFQFKKEIEFFKNEGRILELDFGKWVLLNIYFPNGHSRKIEPNVLKYKLQFYENFLDHVLSIKKMGKSVIVCGDYNVAHREIDLTNASENRKSIGFLPEERIYIDKFLELGFFDVFRHFHPDKKDSYTWWDYRSKARDKNVGWRIDYFFVTANLKSKLISMKHDDQIIGSDHCPIHMEINL